MTKRSVLLALLFAAAFCGACTSDRPDAGSEGKSPPRRIVSHLPSLTEIVYALGAGDRIVGVSDFCTYPEEVNDKPRVGGRINPNIEAVLGLRPDLVLLMENQRDLAAKLKRLGLSVMVLKSESVSGVFDGIDRIGKRLDLEESAQRLKERIHRELDAVRRKAANDPPTPTLIVIGHETDSLRDIWASGAGSFHDELLTIAGGKNIIADSPAAYPKISKEAILQASPETVIVLFSDPLSEEQRKRELALWEPLGYIEAVRKNRICLIGAEWAHKSGPRMPRIARAFYDCLHPLAPAAP